MLCTAVHQPYRYRFNILQLLCNQLDCLRYESISRVHSPQAQRSHQPFHNYLAVRDAIFQLHFQRHLQSQYQAIRFKDHSSKCQLHIEQALSMCHFTMFQQDHKVHYHTHAQHNHHLQLLDNHDPQVHMTKITVSSLKCV